MNTAMDDGRTRAPRKPGRPRNDDAGERRRKRHSVTGQRLAAAISKEDLAQYQYRWINDAPARIFRMTKEDDWEIVHQSGGTVKADSAMGSAVSYPVGQNPDGSPLLAYLCRKKKEWYEADRDEKMAELDRQLEQMRQGYAEDGTAHDYVPSVGIKL